MLTPVTLMINVVLSLGFLAAVSVLTIILVEMQFPETSPEELEKQVIFQSALYAGAEANKKYWKDTFYWWGKLFSGKLLTT